MCEERRGAVEGGGGGDCLCFEGGWASGVGATDGLVVVAMVGMASESGKYSLI